MKIEISGRSVGMFLASAAVGAILTASIGYYSYVLPQRAKYESDIRSAIMEDFNSGGSAGFSPQAKEIITHTPMWDLLSEVGSDYKRSQTSATEFLGLLGTCNARLAAAQQQRPAASQNNSSDTSGYDVLNIVKPGLGTVVQKLAQGYQTYQAQKERQQQQFTQPAQSRIDSPCARVIVRVNRGESLSDSDQADYNACVVGDGSH